MLHWDTSRTKHLWTAEYGFGFLSYRDTIWKFATSLGIRIQQILSGQLISDALVRKGSVKDANEEYVMRLRVATNATDEEIQSALHHLFSSNNQSVQRPQGNFETTHEDKPHGKSIWRTTPQLSHPLQFQNCSRTILFGIHSILYWEMKLLMMT